MFKGLIRKRCQMNTTLMGIAEPRSTGHSKNLQPIDILLNDGWKKKSLGWERKQLLLSFIFSKQSLMFHQPWTQDTIGVLITWEIITTCWSRQQEVVTWKLGNTLISLSWLLSWPAHTVAVKTVVNTWIQHEMYGMCVSTMSLAKMLWLKQCLSCSVGLILIIVKPSQVKVFITPSVTNN